MRQTFSWSLGAFAAATVAGGGCQWLPTAQPKKEIDHQPLTISPKPGLLVGPSGAGGSKAPQELEAQAASHACLAAASEMEKAGQTEEAIRLYEKARQDHPATAVAISRRLGILYDKAGDFAKATVEYDVALKAAPNDADLHNDIGYSYYCRGNNWDTAEKYFRQAVKLQPGNKRAWLNLGLTLAAKGQWQESYDTFLMAVTPGEAHCNVGMCMAWQGLYDDAKAQYRSALDVDPGSQMARIALKKLENPPTEAAKQAAAKGPLDPSKISTVFEHMERIKATEGSAKLRAKGADDTPIVLDIP